MKRLLLVHAPGLTAEAASRGDLAANLSDLIAEGSFAELSGPPDIPSDAVTIPCADPASFDAALGELRLRHPDAHVAVLSESVLISQRPFPPSPPGAALAAADVPRLLAMMTE